MNGALICFCFTNPVLFFVVYLISWTVSLSFHPVPCSPVGRAKMYRVGINFSLLCNITLYEFAFLFVINSPRHLFISVFLLFFLRLSLFRFPDLTWFLLTLHSPFLDRPLLLFISPPYLPLIPPTRQMRGASCLSRSGVTSSPGSRASSALSLCFRLVPPRDRREAMWALRK